ncbi:hypothetical protein [Clostridium botulinum]
MEINYGIIIALVINLVLIFLIIKVIFKAIQGLKYLLIEINKWIKN